MKYKVVTSFGCTSNAIEVNGKLYTGEDSRYILSDYERNKFDEDLFAEIKRMFDSGEIGVVNLIEILNVEDTEYSKSCDTCGSTVVTTTYEF
jgi:hypothetical protein